MSDLLRNLIESMENIKREARATKETMSLGLEPAWEIFLKKRFPYLEGDESREFVNVLKDAFFAGAMSYQTGIQGAWESGEKGAISKKWKFWKKRLWTLSIFD